MGPGGSQIPYQINSAGLATLPKALQNLLIWSNMNAPKTFNK